MNHQKYSVIRTLSSETRFKLVTILMERGPSSVEAMAKAVGMTHSAVSHQLAELLSADIVSFKRDGRHMVYQVMKSKASKIARAILSV